MIHSPKKLLTTYLKATLSLIENTSADDDSLESYIMQSSLLSSLSDQIMITHREINEIMEDTLRDTDPS
jgi:hypothetical protein